jgi:hypothetical protein
LCKGTASEEKLINLLKDLCPLGFSGMHPDALTELSAGGRWSVAEWKTKDSQNEDFIRPLRLQTSERRRLPAP